MTSHTPGLCCKLFKCNHWPRSFIKKPDLELLVLWQPGGSSVPAKVLLPPAPQEDCKRLGPPSVWTEAAHRLPGPERTARPQASRLLPSPWHTSALPPAPALRALNYESRGTEGGQVWSEEQGGGVLRAALDTALRLTQALPACPAPLWRLGVAAHRPRPPQKPPLCTSFAKSRFCSREQNLIFQECLWELLRLLLLTAK